MVADPHFLGDSWWRDQSDGGQAMPHYEEGVYQNWEKSYLALS